MLTPKPCSYGQAGMDQNDTTVSEGDIAIIIDVQMPENSPIQAVRSPSHPIAVDLGSDFGQRVSTSALFASFCYLVSRYEHSE